MTTTTDPPTNGNGNDQPEPREYGWRWGSYRGLTADVANTELRRINNLYGGITPHSVLEAATPEDSVLHPVFTWDNALAGPKWREEEARHLIKNIVIVRDGRKTPAFYNVPIRIVRQDTGAPATVRRVYRPVEDVVRSASDLASAIAHLSAKVEAARQSLEDLRDAAAEANVSDIQFSIIVALGETLATARELASRL